MTFVQTNMPVSNLYKLLFMCCVSLLQSPNATIFPIFQKPYYILVKISIFPYTCIFKTFSQLLKIKQNVTLWADLTVTHTILRLFRTLRWKLGFLISKQNFGLLSVSFVRNFKYKNWYVLYILCVHT